MQVTIYTIGVEIIQLEGEEADLLRAAIEADGEDGNAEISGFLDAYVSSGETPEHFALIETSRESEDGGSENMAVPLYFSDAGKLDDFSAQLSELAMFFGVDEE